MHEFPVVDIEGYTNNDISTPLPVVNFLVLLTGHPGNNFLLPLALYWLKHWALKNLAGIDTWPHILLYERHVAAQMHASYCAGKHIQIPTG